RPCAPPDPGRGARAWRRTTWPRRGARRRCPRARAWPPSAREEHRPALRPVSQPLPDHVVAGAEESRVGLVAVGGPRRVLGIELHSAVRGRVAHLLAEGLLGVR